MHVYKEPVKVLDVAKGLLGHKRLLQAVYFNLTSQLCKRIPLTYSSWVWYTNCLNIQNGGSYGHFPRDKFKTCPPHVGMCKDNYTIWPPPPKKGGKNVAALVYFASAKSIDHSVNLAWPHNKTSVNLTKRCTRCYGPVSVARWAVRHLPKSKKCWRSTWPERNSTSSGSLPSPLWPSNIQGWFMSQRAMMFRFPVAGKMAPSIYRTPESGRALSQDKHKPGTVAMASQTSLCILETTK